MLGHEKFSYKKSAFWFFFYNWGIEYWTESMKKFWKKSSKITPKVWPVWNTSPWATTNWVWSAMFSHLSNLNGLWLLGNTCISKDFGKNPSKATIESELKMKVCGVGYVLQEQKCMKEREAIARIIQIRTF